MAYRRGKRTIIARKRRTPRQRKFNRTMNRVAGGYYNRKAKRTAKKYVNWYIFGRW